MNWYLSRYLRKVGICHAAPERMCVSDKSNSKCKDSGDEHGVYVFKIKMIKEKGDRS